jgi:hypothetical protein
MLSFITFIYEDEHGLSLGMLMHAKVGETARD